MTCEECKYWRRVGFIQSRATWGDCRRFPPTHSYEDGPVFPRIEKTEWCGEFEPTPKEEPWIQIGREGDEDLITSPGIQNNEP